MHRSIIVVLAAALVIVMAVAAHATDTQSIEGSLMLDHFDYHEMLSGGLKSTESGTLPGGRVAYYRHSDAGKRYLRILLEYTDAPTLYDGTLDNGQPITDHTRNTLLTVEGDYGLSVATIDNVPVVFYGGIGQRAWDRNLQGSGSYSEYYRWCYLSLGLRGDFPLSPKLTGTLDLSVRPTFNGNVTADFSRYDPTYGQVKLTLGSKLGWRAEAPVHYVLDQRTSLVVTPWYEYSAIGASNIAPITGTGNAVYVQEPDSNTHQYGINAGIDYRF